MKYCNALQANSPLRKIVFVCPAKFCISIVSSFSWELPWSEEKTKTMLMQNLGGQTKSIMVFSELAYYKLRRLIVILTFEIGCKLQTVVFFWRAQGLLPTFKNNTLMGSVRPPASEEIGKIERHRILNYMQSSSYIIKFR